MAIPYKKLLVKDPRDKAAAGKYYPRLMTLGNHSTLEEIAYVMKERCSLTVGDIKNVLDNFIEVIRTSLYGGQSVRIKGFGTFRLGARTKGVETLKACTVKNILGVTIRFVPSGSVKPNLHSTRAGEYLRFFEVDNKGKAVTGLEEVVDGDGNDTPTTETPNLPALPPTGGGGSNGNDNGGFDI
jgi:predicted histone-like DNA-binding protein